MKRLLAVGMALCLLFAAAPFSSGALAEESLIALTVETASAQQGDSLTVSVQVANPGGMDSLQFALNYDPAALSVLEVFPGEMTKGGLIVYNTEVSGVVQAAFASALGITEGGVLLTVRFQVLTAAGSPVLLTDALASRVDDSFVQTKAYLSVTDGGVSVGGAPLPAISVTPWPVETPAPTPTPEPTPTPTPTPYEIESVASETPVSGTPEPAPEAASGGSAAPLLIAAGAALLVIAALILLLSSLERRRKARSKRRTRREDD